jgi:hypothetical protein
MSRRVRTKAALAAGSAVAVCFLVFGTVCSVDRAGLSNVDGSVPTGGSGGLVAAAGGGNGTGGGLGGSGNSGTGGTASGSGGSNPAAGSGGGSGGSGGLGGAIGTGGDSSGSGGDQGTGGNGSGGDQGTGGNGSGGNLGSGGDTSGSGGTTSTGGVPGSGGTAGSGTGGAQGTGGTGGTTGTGGTNGTGGNHPPSCSSFPSGSVFTPPNDNVMHCYWAHSEQVDWETAEASCVSEGGTLATVLSSQENMAVFQLGMRSGLFAGMAVAWLGANDGKQSNDKSGPGTYAWVTGEAWGYTNWHAMQPDGSCTCQLNSACNCDHWLAIGGDGTWYDRADNSGRPYICEAVAR